jgi:hypothetical protein
MRKLEDALHVFHELAAIRGEADAPEFDVTLIASSHATSRVYTIDVRRAPAIRFPEWGPVFDLAANVEAVDHAELVGDHVVLF